ALLFSDEEVGELVSSLNSKTGYLPTDAATILFHFTGGHPLHLQQLLVHIDNIWQRIKDPLTTQQLLWILEQGAAVISSCGAAPNFLGIHKSTKKYLRHII